MGVLHYSTLWNLLCALADYKGPFPREMGCFHHWSAI